jgi:surfactin synthase thioesterase subunit
MKRSPLQLTSWHTNVVTLLQTLELKLLLKASAEQPPFVLVGHSVGAMYASITAFRFCMTCSVLAGNM